MWQKFTTLTDYKWVVAAPAAGLKVCYVPMSPLAPANTGSRLQIGDLFAQFVTAALSKAKPINGELEVTSKWAAKFYPGIHQLEVPCAAGRVDILVPSQSLIIEAKVAKEWKHAVGQVLVYRECFKMKRGGDWAVALLLIGRPSDHDKYLITNVCNPLSIVVHWVQP